MCEYIKIDIAGVEEGMISTLREKAVSSNIQINELDTNNTISLQIKTPIEDSTVLSVIENFLTNFKTNKKHDLSSSYIFDESNSLIETPTKKHFLTKRELTFLKLLLNSDSIITYEDMIAQVWEKGVHVTQNAMRLFTRNLRKKLPPKVLKNLQGVGYKLVL